MYFDIAIIALLVIVLVLLIFLLVKNKPNNTLSSKDVDDIKRSVEEASKPLKESIDTKLEANYKQLEQLNNSLYEKISIKLETYEKELDKLKKDNESLKDFINTKFNNIAKDNSEFYDKVIKLTHEENEKVKDKLSEEIKEFNKQVKDTLKDFDDALKEKMTEFTKSNKETLEKLEKTVKENLDNIRKDNTEQLDKINVTVGEKLEKTLEGKLKDSFDNVIKQIGNVNEAMGEIKGLASDVGSLKTVLTNVKTKGIVGEVILGNIIKDILTVNQYDENVATKKNSQERVEFAIKMPGDNDSFIYLPIDSKLPLESYQKIKDGMEKGDANMISEARKSLKQSIKQYAKDIANKYIDVPNTTDFAIMFLPIEGLYIEALDLGLFEEIQREYKVNLAGPTTLTAILNALVMGFKTLVIQKKSSEVFKLLGAVKTEFGKFADVLEKTQKKVGEASDELDKLVGTRTRMIRSKLNNIEGLEEQESTQLIEN